MQPTGAAGATTTTEAAAITRGSSLSFIARSGASWPAARPSGAKSGSLLGAQDRVTPAHPLGLRNSADLAALHVNAFGLGGVDQTVKGPPGRPVLADMPQTRWKAARRSTPHQQGPWLPSPLADSG